MESILLKDPGVFPDEKVLKKALGKGYTIYSEMLKTVTSPPISLSYEWRYYNDGKAWLCKFVQKKKTVFWLSVWEEECLKTAFYFTDKTSDGISSLDIDEKLKMRFSGSRHIGKLIPLTLEIKEMKDIDDLVTIAIYKMKN